MNRRTSKGLTRSFGSMMNGSRLVVGRRDPACSANDETLLTYMFPTVEGPDAEYVKVMSGKVSDRRPSFA